MSQSYRDIVPALAGKIKLRTTDVDGTIIASADCLSPAVLEAIRLLEIL
jgi:hydroxymethylpyrimidine pyrophosphatase-like HAD family hydrolase